MKYIIILISTIFIFSSCTSTKYILVPQAEYYPTFSVQDFSEYEDIDVKVNVKKVLENNTTVTYIIVHEDEFIKFLKYTKTIKNEHNLLLRRIKEFNTEINKINEEQKNKKPIEVK